MGESERLPHIEIIPGGANGTGIRSGYWDCCKPSCAWKGNIHSGKGPVTSCAKDGITKVDTEAFSGCGEGGKAYMCSNQIPWIVNKTLAYGFSAVSLKGGADFSSCCACFMLNFGKRKLVVQNTNTGTDLHQNQFDLAIPGAGVGKYTLGCQTQWNAPQDGWGRRYGGVTSEAECAKLPKQLQQGCKFRFEWKMPTNFTFVQVKCPAELVKLSGCEI